MASLEWPKRANKKGTNPQTGRGSLLQKGEVIEEKEQKRLGNHRMSRSEGTLETISSKSTYCLHLSYRRTFSLTVTCVSQSLPPAYLCLCCSFHLSRSQQQKNRKVNRKNIPRTKVRKEVQKYRNSAVVVLSRTSSTWHNSHQSIFLLILSTIYPLQTIQRVEM